MDGAVVQADHFPVTEAASACAVLRQALQRPYLMDYRFQSVEVVAEVPTTIVPLEHFRKGDMVAFYRLSFPTQQVSVSDMQYQILTSLETVMIFRLEQDILRTVQEYYPDARVVCGDGERLLSIAAAQSQSAAPADDGQRDAYVCVDGGQLFVAVFHRGALQYAASQPADNDPDRLYLLLGIWKALDMHVSRDVCHLQGASDGMRAMLGEYLLNVE